MENDSKTIEIFSGTKVIILESDKTRAKMVVDDYYENLKRESDE